MKNSKGQTILYHQSILHNKKSELEKLVSEIKYLIKECNDQIDKDRLFEIKKFIHNVPVFINYKKANAAKMNDEVLILFIIREILFITGR